MVRKMSEQLKGIDVSAHQKNIDWDKVKASGIDFAIIRVGYGKRSIDKYFKKNIEGALRVGLKVGVYWFIYATSSNTLVQNANSFYKAIAPYKDKITMKVWCDFEYDTDAYANKNGVIFTKQSRTEYVKRFCDTMKAYGFDTGVYANPDYLRTKFGDLSMYPLWLAAYANTKPNYDCFMWQHSSKGKVNGIVGNVDMNICYGMTKEEDQKPKPTLNPYKIPTRTLKKTSPFLMKGEDVKWLQFELVAEGYLPAKNSKGKSNVDGSFGKLTDNAVRQYQLAHGLVVDGKVGPATRKELQKNL